MELIIARHKSVDALNSKTNHVQPVFIRHKTVGSFQRIVWRHNEPHLIEFGKLPYLACQRNMPVVHGVKRSAENADFHVVGLFVKEAAYSFISLLLCCFKIVVNDNMVELRCKREFKFGSTDAVVDNLRSIRATPVQAVAQFLY